MCDVIKFDYFYGDESEQFSFFRIPRLLMKDAKFKKLSSDAKILYGMMLDRMSLSIKNGWLDKENRAYIIYTVDSVMEDLDCGKDKAVKVLAELDTNKGIGLVERVRRGLGKPDIIYVKNFVTTEEKGESADDLHETKKADFKKSEKPTSGGRKNRLQEVGKTDSNYTNVNYTDMNSIYHICQEENQLIDVIDDTDIYTTIIRKNIDYELSMQSMDFGQRKLFRELYEVICDVVCFKRRRLRVGGTVYPYERVRRRFLRLNQSHLEYVMECLSATKTKIRNIRAYMLTALYRAPDTIYSYYMQSVLQDMNMGSIQV